MSADQDAIDAAIARGMTASNLLDDGKTKLVEAMRVLIRAFGPRILKTIVAGSLAFVLQEQERKMPRGGRARG